jgi:DNA-binding NarL/FixJ family response regulator
MGEGLTDPQIAEHLSISWAKDSSHVIHILQKLGGSNRAEAILFAIRNNLID